jgi:hypothetical protein
LVTGSVTVSRSALSSSSPSSGEAFAGFGFLGQGGEQREIGHGQERAVERERKVAVLAGDRMMNGDELGAVGEGALDLDFSDHGRDAGHDLAAAEELAAEVHQFGDGTSVADELEQLGGDESDGLGVVEAHAAGEAFLGEESRVVQEEFVDVARGEVHGIGRCG